MPCHYDDFGEGDRQLGIALDLATRVACNALKIAFVAKQENIGRPEDIWAELMNDPEIKLWWRNHQIADTKRKLAEKAACDETKKRIAALKKLTPAERKLLGIKQ